MLDGYKLLLTVNPRNHCTSYCLIDQIKIYVGIKETITPTTQISPLKFIRTLSI